jgi:hypothetical protein
MAGLEQENGRGKWRLDTREGKQLVQLIFDTDYGAQLFVSEPWVGSTRLYYFLGDPDSAPRVEFAKS